MSDHLTLRLLGTKDAGNVTPAVDVDVIQHHPEVQLHFVAHSVCDVCNMPFDHGLMRRMHTDALVGVCMAQHPVCHARIHTKMPGG